MSKAFHFRKPPTVSLTYQCNRKCPYCFTAHFKKSFPNEITLSNFERLANWLAEQDLRRIALFGGEPTQHTQFSKLVKIASEREIRMVLATNNIFGRKVANALSNDSIDKAIVNFNEPETYSKKELAIFYKNLGVLKDKGINIIIRFNLFLGMKSLQHIEAVCNKFEISQTYFAFTTPDIKFSKPYASFEEMQLLFPFLKQTVERLENSGVKCLCSLPLPKCALSNEDYKFLEKRGAKAKCGYSKKGKFMPAILIQPDLSVNACARLPFKVANILDYKRIEDVWSEFEPEWTMLAKKPLFKDCESCIYWKNGQCIGSCLVYKFAKSPEVIKYAPRTH